MCYVPGIYHARDNTYSDVSIACFFLNKQDPFCIISGFLSGDQFAIRAEVGNLNCTCFYLLPQLTPSFSPFPASQGTASPVPVETNFQPSAKLEAKSLFRDIWAFILLLLLGEEVTLLILSLAIKLGELIV